MRDFTTLLNTDDMKWRTQSGLIINIKDMTDSHLQNAINMLQRNVTNRLEMLEVGNILERQWAENTLDSMYSTIKEMEKEQQKRIKKLIHPTIKPQT